MAKVKNIEIDIYRLTLTVFVGQWEDFVKYVKSCKNNRRFRDLSQVVEQDKMNYEAATYWNEDERVPIMYLPRLNTHSKTINVITHELAHVCFYILNNVDIQVSSGNDEAFAYLQGWLAEEVFKKEGYEEV